MKNDTLHKIFELLEQFSVEILVQKISHKNQNLKKDMSIFLIENFLFIVSDKNAEKNKWLTMV